MARRTDPETRLRKHIENSPMSVRTIAERSGLSYIRAWRFASGRGEVALTLNEGTRLWEVVTGNSVEFIP